MNCDCELEIVMESTKEEILQLMANWRNALEARDLHRMLANYTPRTVLFDCKPPHHLVGVEAIRNCWEQCLPYFPEKFRSEHANVEVMVNGDLAFFHGFHRFVALVDEEKWKDSFHWLRVTVCFQKVDGNWTVVHEHVSMPFDPMTGQISVFNA